MHAPFTSHPAAAGAAADTPSDQADGLRRLFAGRRTRVLPLVANPHVPFAGFVMDRLAAVLAAHGQEVLVVDVSRSAPPPPELAWLDLAACIEPVAEGVRYLPGQGLVLRFVDTRGSAASLLQAVMAAAPQCQVVLLHAEAADMARLLRQRAVRPVLMGADHPESLKHAYASCKLLVQRAGWMTCDVVVAASSRSPRIHAICDSLAACADQFLGAVLRQRVLVDPALDLHAAPQADLVQLLQEQMNLDPEGDAPGPEPWRESPSPAMHTAVHAAVPAPWADLAHSSPVYR